MAGPDCTHSLVRRVVDQLGDMTTDPATGITAAPVIRWHYECVEGCPTQFHLVPLQKPYPARREETDDSAPRPGA